MKAILFAASVMCAAALVGCSQDTNAPTQPNSNPTLQGASRQSNLSASSTSAGAIDPSTIQLDKVLVDPLDKTDLIDVTGSVKFNVQQVPILSRDEVSVTIRFAGDATSSLYDGPAEWLISGKSEKTLDLGLKNSTTLELTYPVGGNPNNLILFVDYVITNTQVQVEKMWLAPSVY